jgi:class 3 adenylate cyclase
MATVIPKRIIGLLLDLAEQLHAENVRVWRYVDSQKALFGFWSKSDQPDFEGFVAFLRDTKKLDALASEPVADLHNDDDGEHPLWRVEPGYESLKKNHEKPFMESILVHDRAKGGKTFDDVVGVICIDAPYSHYQAVEDKTQIDNLLDHIRDELHKHTLQLFRDGFEAAKEFLRGQVGPHVEVAETSGAFQIPFDKLLKGMGPEAAGVSVYVRSVSNDRRVPIVAGIGDLVKLLTGIEKDYGEKAPKILHESFSSHAEQRLKNDEDEPLLFPGSGDSENFYTYRDWLDSSRDNIIKAVDEDDPRRDQLNVLTTSIIQRGSFGVFPIRWMRDDSSNRQLIGLLCVAAVDPRSFFTWTRRLVIERFCRFLGRLHADHIASLLTRVTERAYDQLIGSLTTQSRLLSQPGPLGLSQANPDRHCRAFILSVDLRKSTELMLRIAPDQAGKYAEVLMRLCERMREAIREELGVFDKFTGDGVLAFFPEFFSGVRRDACYRAIRAAMRCHEAFSQVYRDFWPNLTSVPIPGSFEEPIANRAGLGIGIDLGRVRLVNVGKELTVVGAPVVYACRLSSSAHAYTTLLNFPAFHALEIDNLPVRCVEQEASIKADAILAYRIVETGRHEPEHWDLTKSDLWSETWNPW